MIENYKFGHHDDNLVHHLAQRKDGGWLILNGHVATEWDLIWFARNILHNPYHAYDEISYGKKVLNITAGFNNGTELDYGHIKGYFAKIGIEWEENLGLWNSFQYFLTTDAGYHGRNYFDYLKWMRSRHIDSTSEILFEIHRYLDDIRKSHPSMGLYELYHSGDTNIWDGYLENLDDDRLENFNKIQDNYLKTLYAQLKENDRQFFDTWEHCTDKFFEDSGIWDNGTYHDFRNSLGDMILNSASIFFWGGQWNVMYDYLNFFQLKPFFQEAFRRGTNLFGMSAGVIVMADDVYMIMDRNCPKGYVYPYGKGLGVLDQTIAYSHIVDMSYIRAEDYDVISSIALRHSPYATIGLTSNSTALVENGVNLYSIGSDPVFLLDDRGFIYYLNMYDNCIRVR